jgi:multimeric flavodoxin WrbA
MDGLIFVTPEYNRSVPGCLKNALDIGSRSEKHIFAGVPTVVVSCSTGKMGGYGASQHLKEILLSLGIKLIQPAELYLGNIQSLLDNDRFINNNFIDGILNKAVNSLIRSLELENDSQTINQVAAGKIQSGISRYQLKRTSMNVFDENGTLNCKAEFTVDDSYLSINHITICQDRAGNDFVTIIMLKLLIFASLFELKVIPSCSYAVNFLEEYLIKK